MLFETWLRLYEKVEDEIKILDYELAEVNGKVVPLTREITTQFFRNKEIQRFKPNPDFMPPDPIDILSVEFKPPHPTCVVELEFAFIIVHKENEYIYGLCVDLLNDLESFYRVRSTFPYSEKPSAWAFARCVAYLHERGT